MCYLEVVFQIIFLVYLQFGVELGKLNVSLRPVFIKLLTCVSYICWSFFNGIFEYMQTFFLE